MQDVFSLSDWVDPRQAALLVVDMQNDFCHPEGAFAKRGLDISMVQAMIPTLHEVMDEARRVGVPVIIIRVLRGEHTGWPALHRVSQVAYGPNYLPVFVEGTWGAELYEGFEPQPGDVQLDKNRYGSFTGTNLEIMLRNKGIETLIMTGGATNVCVESTVREGFMLGFNIVLVEDACATISRELHEGTLATARLWFGRVERARDIVACWRAGAELGRSPASPDSAS